MAWKEGIREEEEGGETLELTKESSPKTVASTQKFSKYFI